MLARLFMSTAEEKSINVRTESLLISVDAFAQIYPQFNTAIQYHKSHIINKKFTLKGIREAEGVFYDFKNRIVTATDSIEVEKKRQEDRKRMARQKEETEKAEAEKAKAETELDMLRAELAKPFEHFGLPECANLSFEYNDANDLTAAMMAVATDGHFNDIPSDGHPALYAMFQRCMETTFEFVRIRQKAYALIRKMHHVNELASMREQLHPLEKQAVPMAEKLKKLNLLLQFQDKLLETINFNEKTSFSHHPGIETRLFTELGMEKAREDELGLHIDFSYALAGSHKVVEVRRLQSSGELLHTNSVAESKQINIEPIAREHYNLLKTERLSLYDDISRINEQIDIESTLTGLTARILAYHEKFDCFIKAMAKHDFKLLQEPLSDKQKAAKAAIQQISGAYLKGVYGFFSTALVSMTHTGSPQLENNGSSLEMKR